MLASTSSRATAIFTRRSDLLATMAGTGSEDSLAQRWGRLAAAGGHFDRGRRLAVREQGGDGAAVEVQGYVEHPRLHGRRDAGPQGKLAPVRFQRELVAGGGSRGRGHRLEVRLAGAKTVESA